MVKLSPFPPTRRWRGLLLLTLALVGPALAATGPGAAARPSAPAPDRPLIWVTAADRASILAKIETQPWARTVFAAMQERVREAVAQHGRDPDTFLRGLPLVPSATDSSRHPTFALIDGNMASTPASGRSHSLQRYLHLGTDCAVLFYLTEEGRYARCAADILQAAAAALAQMPRNDATSSGGIVYPGDVLYEARAIGAQLPLLYDFLHGWLRAGAQVHDLVTRQAVSFDFARAQHVFRTYARLTIEHGQINSNHPVLEMPCLALNALALDDAAERAELLAYLTTKDAPNQDSLQKVMAIFANAGGIWPESFQYSVGVATRVTYLSALLRRQSPPALATAGFAAFPLSLVRLMDFRFPNGDNIRIGDGPRRSSQPWAALEMAYALAEREGDRDMRNQFGALLNRGIAAGDYDRAVPQVYPLGAESYHGPLQLLWFAREITGTMTAPAPRVTDALPFAGVVLQRNLGPTQVPAHALMTVVSGASYVHSHASGMALELYGAGQVLGANAGKGTYTTDDHENHRRLFAAYNSVIVNGGSRSGGGWVNLGIDSVQPIALEPAVGAAPVSSQHSFTLTRFTDRQMDGGTARQQRLVGIVRTSPTTGYYVDVFRSRTAAPDQFHDYLYHNLGDTLALTSEAGPLPLTEAPNRFPPAPGTTWARNRSYLYPGWHVFTSVRASALFTADVRATFTAGKLQPVAGWMRLFIPGAEGRDYVSALAPETKEAPSPYDRGRTPVLVIRQRGEAWTRPFAVVYEPGSAAHASDGIQSVTTLRARGEFAGLKITRGVGPGARSDYVLVPSDTDQTFEDAALGLSFRGRYGVVTLDAHGVCTQLYVGDGTRLRFRDRELVGNPAAFAEFAATPAR